VDSDGWAWLLSELRKAKEPSPLVLTEIHKLGECLGELHTVLSSDPDNPAFAPEPIGTEDFQRWSSSIIGELGVTIAAASEKVPELAGHRDALVERISRLAQVDGAGRKIRLHGDLHLGQTLRSNGKWLVFDFEGEPARAYPQRREKHTPLRDVAGMLRSFAYAAATLELEGAPEADREGPIRREFLSGYRTRASPSLLPTDDETFEVVLQTMELEKLLYELRYEMSHRPDWVRIPARSLLSLEER
jgi:trehalose synthase-fused probable maltokinase